MPARQIRNLQIGFGLSLFLLFASSLSSFISIREMISSGQAVDRTHAVIQKLKEVISFTKDAETGQRGFLLTHDVTFLAPYNGSRERVLMSLDDVKVLTADNAAQQEKLAKLRDVILQRFAFLKISVDSLQNSKPVDPELLRRGRDLMNEAREIVANMVQNEEALLAARTQIADKYSKATPFFIILAAVLAVLITIYFYKRVAGNFKKIDRLNKELLEKDRQIAARIDAIQKIAGTISKGDYSVRAGDLEKDSLGALAGSLNKMAESLERSFNEMAGRQWSQQGAAELSEVMVGDKPIQELCTDIAVFLSRYTDSKVGAFYMVEGNKLLSLKGGYSIVQNGSGEFEFGEGLIGQCARDGKPIELNHLQDADFTVSFAAGQIKPAHVYVFPVFFERRLMAVIELGSMKPFTPLQRDFLQRVSESIGTAVNTAVHRLRLQELLEETQSQAEELQAQHSELENLNTELETHAHKLQASEEELKVQQEELMQTNQELEERSRLLEEKNHLIVIRNLEVQKKAEELAESARYKSEFLANMSHELRTPLNSILLLSRLLAENTEGNLKDDQIEYARVIQSSGNGLLQLIDEILDLSRIESGKMQLDYEVLRISEIVNGMQNLFGPLAKEKQVAFTINVSSDVPAVIETDRMRLEQILKNLISNALKFTNKGSIELSIRLSKIDKNRIEFSVKDSGIGIPPDKQELIFEAFQQADGSTRRKYGGTGLGLSISRQLAQLLGGAISLTSEAGAGSDFVVTIPISKQPPLAKPEASSPIFTRPASAIVAVEAEASRENNPYIVSEAPESVTDDRGDVRADDKVILIIEDDTLFAKRLLDFAHKKGYKGIVAVRGDEGIELAKHFKPMGILLDIQLPVKSGWEVMDEIKQDARTRHIPVHIISSFEMKKESLSKGAVDFVYKPAALDKMDDIFRKIENVVKGDSRKVLIVEDNPKHAQALAYFLSTYNIKASISPNINESVQSLHQNEVDCVILDMGIPDMKAYQTLDAVKKNAGFEDIPVLIFTGKSLSRSEEIKIKQYADSIVMKTAHSYQRILDEVSLFLHLVEENNKNPKSKNGSSGGTGSLAEVLANKKVLIADDDVRNIYSLTRILEKHKMQVVSATDGKEALQVLEKNPDTHIVLMDIMMPEMDGFEAIASIRQQQKWRNLPVIALTAKAMTGDREKCIKAGASDYISKPVDIDQLISLLRIWLYENYKC
jgi:signal transduction histidine kinase/DNA-binding response OmpR family regulator/CHASE3 domain sensor protein/HAMP domain-containing protein